MIEKWDFRSLKIYNSDNMVYPPTRMKELEGVFGCSSELSGKNPISDSFCAFKV
ncbi:MAG: hypothetical protein H5T38_03670 [Methanobacteriaceae archaeon]|nr:hypothetical protein [Methanobacteriaceae archaeon]